MKRDAKSGNIEREPPFSVVPLHRGVAVAPRARPRAGDTVAANEVGRPALAIGDLLAPQDIVLDVQVDNKAELFAAIALRMESAHGMARDAVAVALRRREQAGSTAMGHGVAIPHARVSELDVIRIAYFRLKSPIPFDAPDGKPVCHVLVLLVPKQATEDHLLLLADASRLFSDPGFRARLHACRHPAQVKRLIEERSSI